MSAACICMKEKEAMHSAHMKRGCTSRSRRPHPLAPSHPSCARRFACLQAATAHGRQLASAIRRHLIGF